jgi:hypothetical protein
MVLGKEIVTLLREDSEVRQRSPIRRFRHCDWILLLSERMRNEAETRRMQREPKALTVDKDFNGFYTDDFFLHFSDPLLKGFTDKSHRNIYFHQESR